MGFASPLYAKKFWDSALSLRYFGDCAAVWDDLPQQDDQAGKFFRYICVSSGSRKKFRKASSDLQLIRAPYFREPIEAYKIGTSSDYPWVVHHADGRFDLHMIDFSSTPVKNYDRIVRKFAPLGWRDKFAVVDSPVGPALAFRPVRALVTGARLVLTPPTQPGREGWFAARAHSTKWTTHPHDPIAKWMDEHWLDEVHIPLNVSTAGAVLSFVPHNDGTGVRWSIEGNGLTLVVEDKKTSEHKKLLSQNSAGWTWAKKYSSMFDPKTATSLIMDNEQPWSRLQQPEAVRYGWGGDLIAEVIYGALGTKKVPADHWVWELAGLTLAAGFNARLRDTVGNKLVNRLLDGYAHEATAVGFDRSLWRKAMRRVPSGISFIPFC